MDGDNLDGRDDAGEPPEPARLRHLRRLVNALLITLIIGVITVVAVIVIRLGPFVGAPPLPETFRLPETVVLPAGERAGSVTMGRDWIAVLTIDADGAERIRVFDRDSGAERAVTRIAPAE